MSQSQNSPEEVTEANELTVRSGPSRNKRTINHKGKIMKRLINTMALSVTALTLTVLSTTTAFADKGGKGGSGNHGSSQGSFKQGNQNGAQLHTNGATNQANVLHQTTQNTMKQTNFTQNFNHNNGSQFKKTDGYGKDFKNFKKDYCWDKYYHDFCYNNRWGCWNYGCWNSCYSYCGYYPCCSSYCLPVTYTVSPVFATEVIVPEVVVPQLAVTAAVVTPAVRVTGNITGNK
jgi:hypothetical protein